MIIILTKPRLDQLKIDHNHNFFQGSFGEESHEVLYIFSSSLSWESFFFCRGLFWSLMFQPNNFVRRWAQRSVRLSDFKVTIFNGWTEPFTIIDSPSFNLNLVAPSRLTQAPDLASSGFLSFISALAGSINGRNDKLCGANGVMQMQDVLL